jgi:hypothetical protein
MVKKFIQKHLNSQCDRNYPLSTKKRKRLKIMKILYKKIRRETPPKIDNPRANLLDDAIRILQSVSFSLYRQDYQKKKKIHSIPIKVHKRLSHSWCYVEGENKVLANPQRDMGALLKWNKYIIYRENEPYIYVGFMSELGFYFFHHFFNNYFEKNIEENTRLIQRVKEHYPLFPYYTVKCGGGIFEYPISFLYQMNDIQKKEFPQKLLEICEGNLEKVLFVFIYYLQNYIEIWEQSNEYLHHHDETFEDQHYPYAKESRLKNKLEETTIDIETFLPLNEENFLFFQKMIILEIEAENLASYFSQKIPASILCTKRLHLAILIALQGEIPLDSILPPKKNPPGRIPSTKALSMGNWLLYLHRLSP